MKRCQLRRAVDPIACLTTDISVQSEPVSPKYPACISRATLSFACPCYGTYSTISDAPSSQPTTVTGKIQCTAMRLCTASDLRLPNSQCVLATLSLHAIDEHTCCPTSDNAAIHSELLLHASSSRHAILRHQIMPFSTHSTKTYMSVTSPMVVCEISAYRIAIVRRERITLVLRHDCDGETRPLLSNWGFPHGL